MHIALLDTCVLHPMYLCDTLLCLAEKDVYQPRWSADILGELQRTLLRRGIPAVHVARRVETMRSAFETAEVVGHETLVASMTNDPKDRHVLAAAVHAGAHTLVTFNVRDFPDRAVADHDVVVVEPDAFLLERLDRDRDVVIESLHGQVTEYRRPPNSIGDLLAILARTGAPRFAAEVGRELG